MQKVEEEIDAKYCAKSKSSHQWSINHCRNLSNIKQSNKKIKSPKIKHFSYIFHCLNKWTCFLNIDEDQLLCIHLFMPQTRPATHTVSLFLCSTRTYVSLTYHKERKKSILLPKIIFLFYFGKKKRNTIKKVKCRESRQVNLFVAYVCPILKSNLNS
jgi:hypothetical protein